MAIGYHRQRLEQHFAGVSERMLLGISGAFVAMVIAVHVGLLLPSLGSHGMIIDHLFGKLDLRIGRLLVFAGFFVFAFASVTVAWGPIRRALGWLLLPLGQDALSAYILHLFVVAPGDEGQASRLRNHAGYASGEHLVPIDWRHFYLGSHQSASGGAEAASHRARQSHYAASGRAVISLPPWSAQQRFISSWANPLAYPIHRSISHTTCPCWALSSTTRAGSGASLVCCRLNARRLCQL